MNRKLDIFGLAVSFIGSVLGAGFVSGQELWLYFGCYGRDGLIGLALSIFLLSLNSVLVLRIAFETNASTIDLVLFSEKTPSWIRDLTGFVFVFFYFCVATVMLAGIASLGLQLLGIPKLPGGLLAALLILAVSWFGLSGMTALFRLSIPVLVAAAVLISLIRLGQAGPSAIVLTDSASNPLLGNYLFSAVNYAACNIFASVGILCPLAAFLQSKKTVSAGVFSGGTVLFLIAVFILLALATSASSVLTDLPMLELSVQMGSFYGAVYGILLFLGMFGCGVSTFVSVNSYLNIRFRKFSAHRLPLLAGTVLFSFLLSLCGFSGLVNIVYPVMGYVGILSMLLVLIRALKLRRK